MDGDTDIDADDHDLLDRQGTWQDHEVVLDEAGKRIRAVELGHFIEIVHGEHDVLVNAEVVTLRHPTQGAVIKATIESERGCTFFTNPRFEETIGAITYIYMPGTLDFGDAMTGISNGAGRFVGPQVAPALTQPPGYTLFPYSHLGTSDPLRDWNLLDIWVDTTCEEQATIHIDVGYPGPVGSLRLPAHEEISINWVTIELAKQPQIRWAGEEIVLAKRWALPDDWFPNPGQEECPLATIYDVDDDGDIDLDDADAMGRVVDHTVIDYQVHYVKNDPSPGDLEGAYADDDGDGHLDSLHAGDGTTADGDIDRLCISKALYGSEEPGQVSVQAQIIQVNCPIEGGPCDEYLVNEHAFLVWYLKIYQVKLTNVDGEREDHSAGEWTPSDPWDTSTDVTEEERNVSSDALARVRVKGWFETIEQSGRGAVCLDMDGDGEGAGSPPGEPYPTIDGCADVDDEPLPAGHWVLPDDLPVLAGADPMLTRPNWDVMQGPDGLISDSPGLIGPKSTLDSHDATPRSWIPCLPGVCPRKTVAPAGAVDIHAALMPPLKIRTSIADPLDEVDNDGDTVVDEDTGFLKGADKKADVYTGGNNLYYRSMIPAEPEILPFHTDRSYDWDSWLCRIEDANLPPEPGMIACPPGADGLALGPYEFWTITGQTCAPNPGHIEF
ncbi:MAG: hypothetical protein E3J29_00755, partial [Dehalococcoidia bacterium]